MRSQIRGLEMGTRNIHNATSMTQVIDKGFEAMSNTLQEVRDLVVSRESMEAGSDEETIVNAQITELLKGLNDTVSQAKFNNKSVFADGTINVQTGANSGDSISFTTYDVTKLDGMKEVVGKTGADLDLDKIDAALTDVGSKRGEIGAVQNRLESSAKLNDVMNVNMESAYSRIMDVDVAKETLNLLKAESLQNASLTMMAQAANMQAGMVSKLLSSI